MLFHLNKCHLLHSVHVFCATCGRVGRVSVGAPQRAVRVHDGWVSFCVLFELIQFAIAFEIVYSPFEPSNGFEIETESDCGVRVFLNEHAVIVDRMPQPTEEEAFAFNSVPLVSPEEVSKIKKTESKKTELVAGEKYRIRLELVHSSHLKYSHPDTGVLRQARCSFSDLAALLFFEFKFNFNLQTLQTDSCGGAARRSRR